MAAQNNPSCLVRAEHCAATVQSNLGHTQVGRGASSAEAPPIPDRIGPAPKASSVTQIETSGTSSHQQLVFAHVSQTSSELMNADLLLSWLKHFGFHVARVVVQQKAGLFDARRRDNVVNNFRP